jgi:hypothetical protein
MIAMRSAPALLALSWLWLCGCALSQTTVGTPIGAEQLGEIAVGRSTRADVARVLGAPDEIIYSNLEHDPLFERAYRYHREKRRTTYFTVILFSASRADTNSDNVVVFFDEKGVVEDVGTRLDMHAPRYGVPWGGASR